MAYVTLAVMDVYWSIERCGWVPSRGPAEPLATAWSMAAPPVPEPGPVPDLPLPRSEQPVPAERQ